MSKKIFITGCAKSGTTLLLRMCYAFKETEVIYKPGYDGHELSFNDFVKYESSNKFIIGKRHPPTLLSNIYENSFHEQSQIIKDNKIGIINVVRDGRDVVLSDGNYVKPDRWISSLQQRDTFRDIIDLEIKYEDLINNADFIQEEMEKTFGLTSNSKFSNYPDYVEDWVYDWNVSVLAREGKGNFNSYGKRKLSNSSIGKDVNLYKEICSKEELPVFNGLLKEMNYI
jgi:hypothetical protein